MKDALIGDRREEDGEGEGHPGDLHPRIDGRYVFQHARPQPDALEGLGVPAKGDLVGRAAGQVLVRAVRQALARGGFEVVDGQQIRQR